MSLLVAYFDTSVVSFLFRKCGKDVEFFTFPYVYTKGTLSNQCSEPEFYKFLIEKFLADRQVKFENCDIFLSGFLNPPQLPFEPKFSAGVVDVVKSSEDFTPIVVNNSSFFTKDIVSAFSSRQEGGEGEELEKDMGEFDYYGNLLIYPQIVSDNISTQSDLDEKIVEKVPLDFKVDPKKKVVFTGGRFSQNVCSRELNYVLMLNLLGSGIGIYPVYLDTKNAFLLFQTMKMYDKDLDLSIEDHIENSGLFIKSGGAVECLLSTGIGEDQFFEIEKDKVYVMPLKLELPARLSVKCSSLGSVEIKTEGGEVGLVFDTRTDNSSIYSNIKIFNDSIKQFGRAMAKV